MRSKIRWSKRIFVLAGTGVASWHHDFLISGPIVSVCCHDDRAYDSF